MVFPAGLAGRRPKERTENQKYLFFIFRKDRSLEKVPSFEKVTIIRDNLRLVCMF